MTFWQMLDPTPILATILMLAIGYAMFDTPMSPHPWPLSKEEDDAGWVKFEAFKKKTGGILLPLRIQWEGLDADSRRSWSNKEDDQ